MYKTIKNIFLKSSIQNEEKVSFLFAKKKRLIFRIYENCVSLLLWIKMSRLYAIFTFSWVSKFRHTLFFIALPWSLPNDFLVHTYSVMSSHAHIQFIRLWFCLISHQGKKERDGWWMHALHVHQTRQEQKSQLFHKTNAGIWYLELKHRGQNQSSANKWKTRNAATS